jgi:hypothetical protein
MNDKFAKVKRFGKNGFVAVLMLVALAAPVVAWPTASASAGHCTSKSFLTLPQWYRGVVVHDSQGKCAVKIDNLNKIWVIVLNVTDMLLQVVGYVAAGFVLYGGFRYVISNGNPDDISKAKDTIIKALIGMVVAMSAAAIVGFIVGNVR